MLENESTVKDKWLGLLLNAKKSLLIIFSNSCVLLHTGKSWCQLPGLLPRSSKVDLGGLCQEHLLRGITDSWSLMLSQSNALIFLLVTHLIEKFGIFGQCTSNSRFSEFWGNYIECWISFPQKTITLLIPLFIKIWSELEKIRIRTKIKKLTWLLVPYRNFKKIFLCILFPWYYPLHN